MQNDRSKEEGTIAEKSASGGSEASVELAFHANFAEAEHDAAAGSGPAKAHLRAEAREQQDLLELPAHGQIGGPSEARSFATATRMPTAKSAGGATRSARDISAESLR